MVVQPSRAGRVRHRLSSAQGSQRGTNNQELFLKVIRNHAIQGQNKLSSTKLLLSHRGCFPSYFITVYLSILAGGVYPNDSLVVSKIQTELRRVGGSARVGIDQFVSFLARALEAPFRVGAELVTKAPLLALVAIWRQRGTKGISNSFEIGISKSNLLPEQVRLSAFKTWPSPQMQIPPSGDGRHWWAQPMVEHNTFAARMKNGKLYVVDFSSVVVRKKELNQRNFCNEF